jgi:hypothetical protein
MASGWFLYLEDAIVDSHMASDLRISNVVEPGGTIVHVSLSLEEAFARRDGLDAARLRPIHHVVYRSRHPEGVR